MNATSPTQDPSGMSSLGVLSAGLLSVLAAAHCPNGSIAILARDRNDYVSSYPSEVVTCRLADGSVLRLFCKYSAAVDGQLEFGHRGGMEAAIRQLSDQPQLRADMGRHGGEWVENNFSLDRYIDKVERFEVIIS